MSNLLPLRFFSRPDQPQSVYKGALGTTLWEAPLYAAIGDAQCNASFISDRGPRLDVSKYDWAPEFGWVNSSVNDVTKIWSPVWSAELGYRSADGPKLNVSGQDWNPEFSWPQRVVEGSIAPLSPVWNAELGYLSNKRPPLDIRQYEWSPELGWINPAVDSVTRTWGPVWNAELGYRSADGPRLNVSGQDWNPEFSWPQPIVDSIVRTWSPMWPPPSYRSGDRPVLNVSGQDWSPEFSWPQPVVDAIVRTWLPAITSQLTGVYGATRLLLDTRYIDTSSPAWIFVILPAGATVAQMLPAFLQAQAMGLVNARSILDVRQWMFQQFGTPEDANPWQQVGIWLLGSGANDRLRAGKTLDLLNFTWGQDAWITNALPVLLTIAQQWPAIFLGLNSGYRSGDRLALDTRLEWAPQIGWVPKSADSIIATWSPIWTPPSYRSADRLVLNVSGQDWSPEFSWTQPIVDASIAPLMGAIMSEISAVRSGARPSLDVRQYDWTAEPAWIFYVPPPTPGTGLRGHLAIQLDNGLFYVFGFKN